MNKKQTITEHFERFTKDFTPVLKPIAHKIELADSLTSYHEEEIKIPYNKVRKAPFIVFIILVKLLKFPFQGRWEKVLWEIPISYKGTPFILSHRKLGFQMISLQLNPEEDVQKIGREAIENLEKAIPFAEALYDSEIREKVNNGEISLPNEYKIIRGRYQYFRKKAAAIYKKNQKFKKPEDPLDTFIHEMTLRMFTPKEANYFAIAMLDAFFSLLEHTFVLLLPFIDHPLPEDISLEKFIGLNWKDKFAQVFKNADQKSTAQQLDQLIKIKEQYRNPISHGHFQKNGHSFSVHITDLGAIPMTLTKSKESLNYAFDQFDELKFSEVCEFLDDFEEFINNNKNTHYGIKYIQTGFPVAFDPNSHNNYLSAMKSEKLFEEFLDYTGYNIDTAANMDW